MNGAGGTDFLRGQGGDDTLVDYGSGRFIVEGVTASRLTEDDFEFTCFFPPLEQVAFRFYRVRPDADRTRPRLPTQPGRGFCPVKLIFGNR